MNRAWIRELAEATVNVDFELGFDLKDRAQRIIETNGLTEQDYELIYQTLREGATLFKEREITRGAEESREAADSL
jgi:hypothetical protein